jgi:flagellar biogenesis protein FliO
MSPEATYVLESLATIAVFGGALYAASWGVRRFTGPRGRGPLEVLARQPLDGRRAIYLVRVGKRVLIVGSSDGALTRLGSTTFAAIESELEAPSDAGKTFRDVLSRAVSSKKE